MTPTQNRGGSVGTGCHCEEYKWCLDDCQDDELIPRDPTSLLIHSASMWGEYWIHGLYGDLNMCQPCLCSLLTGDISTSAGDTAHLTLHPAIHHLCLGWCPKLCCKE